MKNNKRVLVFFICLISILYALGIIHGLIYKNIVSDLTAFDIDKTTFINVHDKELDISSKVLGFDDLTTNYYEYAFKLSDLTNIKTSDYENNNYYLMIEKPDTQYFEVAINGINIGREGDELGSANIWNGTYFLQFNETILKENNTLSYKSFSDYMTGVTGDIKILHYDDHRRIEAVLSYSFDIIESATSVAFLIAFILGLIIIAWHKQLYNIKVYIYFLISIIALGISLYDYRELQYIIIDYLLFKKFTIISYHVAITFTSIAVAYLLNAKYKFNIGMIGLVMVMYKVVTTTNMIDFKNSYDILNLFLVAAIIQLVITLIYYRKRGATSVLVMLVGFGLSSLTVAKLVYVNSYSVKATTLIDLPILIIIYTAIVLFVFYNQLLQMVSDQESTNPDIENLGLSGSFVIDRSLCVRGAYSNSCDNIFKRLIIGESIMTLLFEGDEDEDLAPMVFDSIFDSSVDFKEGFIALLPEEMMINKCIYKIDYQCFERADIYLRVYMVDITNVKKLEAEIERQKRLSKFIINALKSKSELGYFIETTKAFINRLKMEGFNLANQKKLHTMKGNLGQFGFVNFEKVVHSIETSINDEYDTNEQIEILEEGLNESLAILEEHLGKNYITEGLGQYIVSKEIIDDIEKEYLKTELPNDDFLMKLKRLKYRDLKEMIYRYKEYINKLSLELSIAVLPFEVSGDKIMLNPEKAEAFIMSLVGIVRNALIHGIETPEKRIEKGKDSYGIIKCTIGLKNENVLINLSDDGRGINLDSLLEEAVIKGIIRLEDIDKLSNTEIINLVFADTLSSKEEVDILAGRGIGLSAVMDEVKELNGNMRIETELGRGTNFYIEIPINSLVD